MGAVLMMVMCNDSYALFSWRVG